MSEPRILVVNGPNLNTLGLRQPEIYGTTTLDQLEQRLVNRGHELGVVVDCVQSNSEGALVDAIQGARGRVGGIVINPAAYSHTSVAILDALLFTELPVVEVHLSNIHRRESFRHQSYVSEMAEAVIAGAGVRGYEFALEFLASRLHPERSA